MNANDFKRLPYGNFNFERIITENYAFVDKTNFIELLENESNKYQFFIRPRKFGKSLLLSMLFACLFQSSAYLPVSEQETNKGYIDIYLLRNPLAPQVKYEWIFELKYFKASEMPTDADRSHAKSQLQNYSGSYSLKDKKDVKKAVVLFVGKDKYELFEE